MYKKKCIVSLGGNCAVSYQLKKYGYRYSSYPFDWCKMNLDQLNKVLENDFQDFNNVSIYKFSENHKLIYCEKRGSAH